MSVDTTENRLRWCHQTKGSSSVLLLRNNSTNNMPSFCSPSMPLTSTGWVQSTIKVCTLYLLQGVRGRLTQQHQNFFLKKYSEAVTWILGTWVRKQVCYPMYYAALPLHQKPCFLLQFLIKSGSNPNKDLCKKWEYSMQFSLHFYIYSLHWISSA